MISRAKIMILAKSQNFVCCTKFRVCTLLKCMKIFRRFTSSKISSPVLQITFLPCTLETSYLISHSKHFLGHPLKTRMLGDDKSSGGSTKKFWCIQFSTFFNSLQSALLPLVIPHRMELFCSTKVPFCNKNLWCKGVSIKDLCKSLLIN